MADDTEERYEGPEPGPEDMWPDWWPKEERAGTVGKDVTFISKDAKRQVALGIVYEPGVVDSQGDWATPEEIEKACHQYMETYRKTGLRHDGKVRDDIVILENYIAPQDMTIGEQTVRKGTWLLGVKVKDAAEWAKVESGELSGLSLFGKAHRVKGREPVHHKDTKTPRPEVGGGDAE